MSATLATKRHKTPHSRRNDSPIAFLRFLEVRDSCRSHFASFSTRHAVYLDSELPMACGSAEDGRCGVQGGRLARATPMSVDDTVVACAAGAGHTILLSDSGSAWSCGRSARSIFGGAPTTRSSIRRNFTRLLLQYRIAHVSASANHCVFVTGCGVALTCGVGSFGRLGHGNQVSVTGPKPVKSLSGERIVHAAAGATHSLFVASSGRAFSCGQGEDGRLGLGPPSAQRQSGRDEDEHLSDDDHYSSTSYSVVVRGRRRAAKMSPLRRTRRCSVAASSSSSTVRRDESDATITRTTSAGLPMGPTADRAGDVTRPQLVLLEKHVKSVAAGAYHSLFLTKDHELYSCGHNDLGQLGHDRHESFKPEFCLKNVAQVAAGTSHTLALTRDNVPLGFGSAELGALGNAPYPRSCAPEPLEMKLPSKTLSIAAGGYSSAFLTECGVYVCGANGEGQLGLGHLENVHAPTLRP